MAETYQGFDSFSLGFNLTIFFNAIAKKVNNLRGSASVRALIFHQFLIVHHQVPKNEISFMYIGKFSFMPILLTGEKFHDDLYKFGSLAVFAPLEGGYETRLLRRMRAKGFKTMISSARGLGDPEVFLLKLHGIRPPHLGHQNIGRNGALGEVQQVIPQAAELFNDNDRKKLLWLIEGQVLSQSELASLIKMSNSNETLKIVVEMGGSRKLRWQSLGEYITNEL